MTAFNSAIARCKRIRVEVLVFTVQVGVVNLRIHVGVKACKYRSET